MQNLLVLIVFFVSGFLISKLISDEKYRRQKLPGAPRENPAPPPPSPPIEVPMDKPLDLKSSELTEKMWLEEEIIFLFRLNETIALSLNREVISRTVVNEVYNFLNADVCLLFLWNEFTQLLEMEFGISGGREMPRQAPIGKGESISGLVLKNRDPLILNNLENYSYYKSINKEKFLKNSIMSVSLSIKGEGLGVLTLCNKDNGKPYTKKDLEFLINIARVGAIAIENIRLLERIQESYLKTITTFALVIDARDHYTKRHSENVTRYSLALAEEAGLSVEEVELIKRAGLLHDIGKIGIRDGILLKPSSLTSEEYEEIKTHPVIGDEIVKSLPFLQDVAVLVRHHHERFDGKGYPDGIIGLNIEIGARILAVADTFDAMTTDRPYRARKTLQEAKTELVNNKSTQFDPQLVDKFLAIIERSPEIVDLV